MREVVQIPFKHVNTLSPILSFMELQDDLKQARRPFAR